MKRFSASLLAFLAAAFSSLSAVGDTLVIDDFTSGPIDLVLHPGVFFEEVRQSNVAAPRGERLWERVYASSQPADTPASIVVDPADSVLRVATPDDPFTYFNLTYGADPRPLGLDALAAGSDRLRLRFRGPQASLYLSVGLGGAVTEDPVDRLRLLGGRFLTVPEDAVVELPFTELVDESSYEAVLSDVQRVLLRALRFQGDFELHAIELASPPAPGDVNRDGVLDAADGRSLASHFRGVKDRGAPVQTSSMTFLTTDLNRDGQVNAADLTLWRDLWETTPTDGPATVPEPAAAALTAAAAAGSLLRRQRAGRP